MLEISNVYFVFFIQHYVAAGQSNNLQMFSHEYNSLFKQKKVIKILLLAVRMIVDIMHVERSLPSFDFGRKYIFLIVHFLTIVI